MTYLHARPLARRASASIAAALLLVVALLALAAPPAYGASTPVMGRAQLTAADLVGWYRSTGKTNRSTEGIDALAGYFIQEGSDEGVAGDLAFAQAIVETGYFAFSSRVVPTFNNFSGLGAVDSGTSAETFPDARTGVRAQIQHLRAYADPTVTASNLSHPLVDTRFNKVSPKGKATTWDQFGGGNWATDPLYAPKVLGIHQAIVDWARRFGTSRFAPFTSPAPFVRQGFRDILYREPSGGEQLLWSTALTTGSFTPEAFLAELFRGEGGTTAQPVTRLYLSALGRSADRGGLAFWTRRRKAGVSIDSLAKQLISSSEFARRYGSPSDFGYVDLLYQNVLGRPADAPGAAFWVGRLQGQRLTRSGLLVQFSESSEHIRVTAPEVEATVVHLGLVLAGPTAEELAWWKAERSAGNPLESLAYHLLIDPRFASRF
ncbi:MAG: DUF4214 domain-containing protein [Aquihabitans sp.]